MAKASTLFDNFNDDTLDTAKWSAVATPTPVAQRIREANGRVEITPASGVSGTNYAYYQSATTYDLTGSYALVEVVRALHQVPSTTTFLSARIDGSNEIYIEIRGGRVNASADVAAAGTLYASVPYDPRAHRWLRLREQGGVTYWETSADNVTYVVLASAANPITEAALTLAIGAGTQAAVASPGFAALDNFNITSTTALSRRVEERRLSARDVRVEAAEVAAERLHDEHHNNNDEANYDGRPFIGNYSKGLKPTTWAIPSRSATARCCARWKAATRRTSTRSRSSTSTRGSSSPTRRPGSPSTSKAPTRRRWCSRPRRASTAR